MSAAEPVPNSPAASGPTPTAPAAEAASIPWADPARVAAFNAWLAGLVTSHGVQPDSLRPASADASFRRYFRVDATSAAPAAPAAQASLIVMDAPPSQEDSQPFVDLARALAAGGLNVPEVLAWDAAHGFMLLTDLGERTYLDALHALDFTSPAGQRRADGLYRDALGALLRLQALPVPANLPTYDAAMVQRELALFPEWYIGVHRGITLSAAQQQVLDDAFAVITRVFGEQPQVLVHRDFHSRNLMPGVPGHADGAPGVLDFQGAVLGPIGYDLASLLRDAYFDWDEAQQLDWAVRYWDQARRTAVPVPADFGDFWRDVDWAALQRHLKVLGIFARLSHRDGKHAYLDHLPRVWQQAHTVAARYSVLRPLSRLLEQVGDVEVHEGYTF
ncbi:MAG: aminoglycoside phosphotransferase family protein [Leptothrix sp. (in: b-proteobacteria)]